jgi:hypothetical protein
MEETILSGRSNTLKTPKRLSWTNKYILVEVICLLLMLNFFYDGIYKIVYLRYWGAWLTHEPFIKHIGKFLKFAIPLVDLTIAFAVLKPSYRILAMYAIIVTQMLFIFWVMSVYLFTGNLFWPYHAFWTDKSTWMQKMSFALLLSWLSFIAIILRRNKNTSY